MPGPGNKSKNKNNAKQKGPNSSNTTRPISATTSSVADSSPSTAAIAMCLTLEEDEMTRCDQPATHGYPRRERCKNHQAQYVKMCKKYKEAGIVVDEIKQKGDIPTEEQINCYTEVKVALEKARFVRTFLEAIRVERIGRDIHSRRFFLKVDQGHKIRLKVLAKEMIKAVEILDCLHSRASRIYLKERPNPDWSIPTTPDGGMPEQRPISASAKDLMAASDALNHRGAESPGHSTTFQMATPGTESTDTDDDIDNVDLIDLEICFQKKKQIWAFELFFDPDFMLTSVVKSMDLKSEDPFMEYTRQKSLTMHRILQQYALRIIFYEPTLFIKSIGKVSLKDLLLSEDFTIEDIVRFALLFKQKTGLGLLWLKDSVVEALMMLRHGTAGSAANIGNPKNRVKVLDGWIYNVAHVKKISDEAWFTIIEMVQPPANVENRFVRLCNTYDDLIGFLSFAAMGNVPPPSFCHGAVAYRNHLSLAGVVIADMVSSPGMIKGPLPTTQRAKQPGCIVWAELENRAYIFGAVKNEPDPFTSSFLNEIRACPDIFHYVIQSESDPVGKVETSGGSSGPVPQYRARLFEAPLSTGGRTGHGEWTAYRSAVDILHGTNDKFPGYLTTLKRGGSAGWFFHFKKFQVKYFVVIDSVPDRHYRFLAQQLAWVALRVRGYGQGEFEAKKYAKASDAFFDKCASERLAWMPKSAGTWTTTKMT